VILSDTDIDEYVVKGEWRCTAEEVQAAAVRLLDEKRQLLGNRSRRSATVEAFLENVVMTKKRGQQGSVAEAFLALEDDADCHEFQVAVPRAFAAKCAEFLADHDEVDETPKIQITFTIPDEEPDPE
jgi:hypothetical protein